MKFIIIVAFLCALTQAMEQKYKYVLFTEECYDEFFVKFNFLNMGCVSKTASKGISFAIVALSVALKLPQIFKIVKLNKTTGLSFDAIFFECLLYSFTIAYNLNKGNPFMLYGENVFILIQNVIISLLFKLYDHTFSMNKFLIKVVLFLIINLPLYTSLVPDAIFDLAIYVNMLLILFARAPQILLNFKNKNTGQLAFLTVFLSFAGAVARSFTVIVSSTDILLIALNLESVVLNGMLLQQILQYWSNKVQPTQKANEKKKQ